MSLVSQFMYNPRKPISKLLLALLLGKGILFIRNKNVSLEAYIDVDYAGSIIDRRSTIGYCTSLGGNLVTWKSKKQSVVAKSSFIVMAQGICVLL